MSLDAVIDDLRAYLELEREEGQDAVRVSTATLEALSKAARAASATNIATSHQDHGVTPRPPVELDLAVDGGPANGAETNPDWNTVATGLNELAAEIATCTRCGLCQSRTRTVPGQGSFSPDIMFVGEGPGAEEDRQGLAFVGKAGQLLTKMIEAMGYSRDDVFIGNVVKCRPPGNRTPELPEMEACMPYLREQIRLLRPKVIVALGATAIKGLLDTDEAFISHMRGQWRNFEGIRMMPTFHPAYLLRQPSGKRDTWKDLQAVLRYLDKPIPPVRRGR